MAEIFSDLAERTQILHGEREFAQAALTWELAEAAARFAGCAAGALGIAHSSGA